MEWNQTEQDYPRELCIHQLIEEQVSRTPEAVAIVSGETALTYQVLEQQATLLANKLVRLNVGPEVCVGLCMERSIEMVIGLLAILKSGGAYVPLEPGYPTERLAFMIQDAAVRLVLTQEKYRERLPRQEGYEKICLDSRDWKETETKQQVERVANKVRPEHLAYVMYTSGSTGVPKGVMVPHRGVVNYLWWCIQAYQIAQGVGSVLHSPLSFDLTVTSLFAPLLVGRSVTLIESRVGAESLLQVLEEQEKAYSLLKLTPAHLDFLQEVWQGRQQRWDLRVMVIGGEALRQEKINFWRERAQGVQLINEYGPTETVVGCSVYNATQDKEKVGPVPIGRPIANTRLYVLDHDQQVVPIGVGGELYIGGDGLARGYLNRPELTAERFIPDGWSGRAGARLYRTGDLVRYREDGNVEYLGRTDHQVKIRGFRVEVGEVEAVLEQHALVQEAVVLAQPLSTGLR
ncbi:MAG TPA: amino acid adenylation domain-containing protein, partial [Ktedonobacteraceae bacterium]|nr:amino acid adenylation domain-containing protein [Ktedonobacteraceae bacterium]